MDPKFGALNEFVPDFRIVNDIAESAIQVLTDYTESITKNKAQRKFLIADTVPQQRLNNSNLCQKALQISIKMATDQENKHYMMSQNC